MLPALAAGSCLGGACVHVTSHGCLGLWCNAWALSASAAWLLPTYTLAASGRSFRPAAAGRVYTYPHVHEWLCMSLDLVMGMFAGSCLVLVGRLHFCCRCCVRLASTLGDLRDTCPNIPHLFCFACRWHLYSLCEQLRLLWVISNSRMHSRHYLFGRCCIVPPGLVQAPAKVTVHTRVQRVAVTVPLHAARHHPCNLAACLMQQHHHRQCV